VRALAMRQTSDRRQACGANHHGGGGLGQPPADAIEASALRARPRWREGAARPAPPARWVSVCRPSSPNEGSPTSASFALISFVYHELPNLAS